MLPGLTRLVAVRVTRRLARRDDVARLGRLAARLDDRTLAACMAVLDDRTLLRTAVLLPDPGRLDAIVAGLHEERLATLLQAAHRHGLQRDAVALLGHLGPAQRRRFAHAAARQDRRVLAGLVRAARAGGVLGEVLSLLPALLRAPPP